MARVLYGPHITNIKGSIGGLSFQENKSGAIVRLRPSTPFISSSRQNERHTAFSEILGRWDNLTLAEQQQWATFAALNPKTNFWGELKNLSGYNWFMSIGILRRIVWNPVPSIPPVYASPIMIPAFTTSLSVTQLLITWPAPIVVSGYTFYYASNLLRTPSLKNRKNLTYVGYSSNFAGSNIDLTSRWVDTFNIAWPPLASRSNLYIIVAAITLNVNTFIAPAAYMSIGELAHP